MIHDPENEKAIDKLYAVISVDGEKREGILSRILHNKEKCEYVPLVFGDYSIAKKVYDETVIHLEEATLKKLRLVEFSSKKILETTEKKGKDEA